MKKKSFNFEGTVFGSNETIKLEITPHEKPIVKDDNSRETQTVSDTSKTVS